MSNVIVPPEHRADTGAGLTAEAWAHHDRRDADEEFLNLIAPNEVAQVPIRDSFENARGWREIGMYYTCVPDAQHPWDPEVVKAIWEFAPNVVPMWVRWVFQVSSDEVDSHRQVVFGRHAIGRYEPNPKTPPIPFECEMPPMPCQGITFKKPNIIDRIIEGDPVPGRPDDLPQEFFPFNWRVYQKLREDYEELTVKEKKEELQAKAEAKMREAERRREEQQRAWADFQRYAQKKVAQLSDVEIKEINGQLREKRRKYFEQMARQTGVSLP